MKKVVIILISALVVACSEQATDVTQKECDAWGGTLTNGECQKDLTAEECGKVNGTLTERGCEVEP